MKLKEVVSMKLKGLCVLLTVTLSLACFIGPVAATKWMYVGTQTLCTGETRVDYLDTDSVVKDSKAGTVVYWVLSENKRNSSEFKMMTKYETKLDFLERTRYLEWHVYDMNNNLMFEANRPQENWQDVEDTTVLGKIVEIACDIAEER